MSEEDENALHYTNDVTFDLNRVHIRATETFIWANAQNVDQDPMAPFLGAFFRGPILNNNYRR